jgi:hypothetical protein
MTKPDPGDTLLTKINQAVELANKAEKIVTTAQAELVSRSKAIGVLLLEARALHPGRNFEEFLKRVKGLHRSRAYDCMRIAGGRVTDDELRRDAAARQQKSRTKKKLQPPVPTVRDVTDNLAEPRPVVVQLVSPEAAHDADSARCLTEFKAACKRYLPRMNEDDILKALSYVAEFTKAEAM